VDLWTTDLTGSDLLLALRWTGQLASARGKTQATGYIQYTITILYVYIDNQ